jgi:hypothetical protein
VLYEIVKPLVIGDIVQSRGFRLFAAAVKQRLVFVAYGDKFGMRMTEQLMDGAHAAPGSEYSDFYFRHFCIRSLALKFNFYGCCFWLVVL